MGQHICMVDIEALEFFMTCKHELNVGKSKMNLKSLSQWGMKPGTVGLYDLLCYTLMAS